MDAKTVRPSDAPTLSPSSSPGLFLDELRQELTVDRDSAVAEFPIKDYASLDLRVPSDSPALKTDCYPRGSVPGVRLGGSRTD